MCSSFSFSVWEQYLFETTVRLTHAYTVKSDVVWKRESFLCLFSHDYQRSQPRPHSQDILTSPVTVNDLFCNDCQKGKVAPLVLFSPGAWLWSETWTWAHSWHMGLALGTLDLDCCPSSGATCEHCSCCIWGVGICARPETFSNRVIGWSQITTLYWQHCKRTEAKTAGFISYFKQYTPYRQHKISGKFLLLSSEM